MSENERKELEEQINEDYNEVAKSCEVELNGCFVVDENRNVKWISLWGI